MPFNNPPRRQGTIPFRTTGPIATPKTTANDWFSVASGALGDNLLLPREQRKQEFMQDPIRNSTFSNPSLQNMNPSSVQPNLSTNDIQNSLISLWGMPSKELRTKAALGDPIADDALKGKAKDLFKDNFAESFRQFGMGMTNSNPELKTMGMTNQNNMTQASEALAKNEEAVQELQAPKPSPLGMLPALGNVMDLTKALIDGAEKTELQRLNFQGVDYNPIIQANNAAINQSIAGANANIENNARTFGQMAGGTSATNLRGAQMKGQNMATLGAQQRNTNAQIRNMENAGNVDIANQENFINQQNRMAHDARIFNNVVGIGTSLAGFGADKAMMGADFIKNQNFLETMKYMSPMLRHTFDGMNLGMGTIYDGKN